MAARVANARHQAGLSLASWRGQSQRFAPKATVEGHNELVRAHDRLVGNLRDIIRSHERQLEIQRDSLGDAWHTIGLMAGVIDRLTEDRPDFPRLVVETAAGSGFLDPDVRQSIADRAATVEAFLSEPDEERPG